jgi:hypothetical protein
MWEGLQVNTQIISIVFHLLDHHRGASLIFILLLDCFLLFVASLVKKLALCLHKIRMCLFVPLYDHLIGIKGGDLPHGAMVFLLFFVTRHLHFRI